MGVRIDKWLWAVRVFKTRSDASEAARTGKVTLRGTVCKPSAEVRPGDVVTVRRGPVTYSYRVVEDTSVRRGAPEAARAAENITSAEELAKLNPPRETVFITRERGSGRPTKRDRRRIDALAGELEYFPNDED